MVGKGSEIKEILTLLNKVKDIRRFTGGADGWEFQMNRGLGEIRRCTRWTERCKGDFWTDFSGACLVSLFLWVLACLAASSTRHLCVVDSQQYSSQAVLC